MFKKEPDGSIQRKLDSNVKWIQVRLQNNDDLYIRHFSIHKASAALIGIDGLFDRSEASQTILAPLLKINTALSENVVMNTIHSIIVNKVQSLEEVTKPILGGQLALLIDGLDTAFLIDLTAIEQRSLEESKNEKVIRGPHVGFSEGISINVSLVRRQLLSDKLKVEMKTLGLKTQTKIAILYLEGTVYPELIEEVRTKLDAVTADAILDSGYVEQFIEPTHNTLFPLVRHSERPQVIVSGLLEGRIGIIVDGSPGALLVPHLFIENFANLEDINSRPIYSSLMRLIRYLGFFISTQLPALYVAVENFHKELVPSNLLLSIAGSREGVPFPLSVETFGMLIVFELIKESGIRMPQAIGTSISMVAGLILGDAAVQAGFVGIPTVIIVSLAGLSSFLVPYLKETDVLLRILMILPAAFLGLYGVILFDVLVLFHVVSLRSFGVPYLAPISPTYFKGWRDVIYRTNIDKLTQADPQKRFNIGRYIVRNGE